MISVVQNFICTKEERLEMLKKNVPLLGKVFDEYTFFVNYNSSINFDEVYSVYKEHIKNLHFYNDLSDDWASIILSLTNEVKTSYVMHLCEDTLVNCDKEKMNNCINEYIINDYDFLLLTKISKYLDEKYIKGDYVHFTNTPRVPYKKLNYGYFYFGKDAPHRRISTDAIYKTDWYKERLKDFILNVDEHINSMNAKSKKTPNCYEEYYDWYNGMIRFPDLKCYIPSEPIFTEFHGVKQDAIWDGKKI